MVAILTGATLQAVLEDQLCQIVKAKDDKFAEMEAGRIEMDKRVNLADDLQRTMDAEIQGSCLCHPVSLLAEHHMSVCSHYTKACLLLALQLR